MFVISTHNMEHNLFPRFSPDTQQQLLTLWCWTLYLNSLQCDAENNECYIKQWSRKGHFWGVHWQPCYIYRMSQEEGTKLWESVPYVKIYRYNPKHLYPELNGYGDNGQRSLKLWQLLHTYWLPNTYYNWQEYVVSVMLISVLNIKLTCEWHKAIKLNYKKTRTVIVVLKGSKHYTWHA